MRITKKERKKNANQFYNMFMNGSCDEAAIVAQKCVKKPRNRGFFYIKKAQV